MSMAIHKVSFNVPDRPLAHADVIFTVARNGEKFGELRVSKGGIAWFPANKVKGQLINWVQLDRLARQRGKRRAKRVP
jgi:hypothetical protein